MIFAGCVGRGHKEGAVLAAMFGDRIGCVGRGHKEGSVFVPMFGNKIF